MRDNLHTAIIASTLRNLFRGKNAPQVGLEDFIVTSMRQSARKKHAKSVGGLMALAKPKKSKKDLKKAKRKAKVKGK